MTTAQPLIASALRTRSEEYLDATTHGIGAVMSLIGGAALILRAHSGGDFWRLAGCSFYVATLVAVYVASTLSHLYLPPKLNHWFRRLDQGCIYLLIVGTYTPFAWTFLRSPFWVGFYLLVLSAAVAGCLSKIVFAHRVQGVCVWLFLGLAFGEAVSIVPLVRLVPPTAVAWMLGGGACYCLGVVFLVANNRRYRFHAIWHVLVMAGSACHFVGIWRYVAVA